MSPTFIPSSEAGASLERSPNCFSLDVSPSLLRFSRANCFHVRKGSVKGPPKSSLHSSPSRLLLDSEGREFSTSRIPLHLRCASLLEYLLGLFYQIHLMGGPSEMNPQVENIIVVAAVRVYSLP